MLGHRVDVRIGVDHDKSVVGEAQVQAGQLLSSFVVCDDQLAVDVADLGLEFSTPAGRVDADDRGPGQGRCAQPEHELGSVLQQDPDVEGTGPSQRLCQRAACRALPHHLIPCPVPGAGTQSEVLVAYPLHEHPGDVGVVGCR